MLVTRVKTLYTAKKYIFLNKTEAFAKNELHTRRWQHSCQCERFAPRSLIVRVNVVLNRTVVVDSDWHFETLCGVHVQSQNTVILIKVTSLYSSPKGDHREGTTPFIRVKSLKKSLPHPQLTTCWWKPNILDTFSITYKKTMWFKKTCFMCSNLSP